MRSHVEGAHATRLTRVHHDESSRLPLHGGEFHSTSETMHRQLMHLPNKGRHLESDPLSWDFSLRGRSVAGRLCVGTSSEERRTREKGTSGPLTILELSMRKKNVKIVRLHGSKLFLAYRVIWGQVKACGRTPRPHGLDEPLPMVRWSRIWYWHRKITYSWVMRFFKLWLPRYSDEIVCF